MSSITARILRKVLPHLDESASEQIVRRVATIFSVSDPEQHADLIKQYTDGMIDAETRKRLAAASVEEHQDFMRNHPAGRVERFFNLIGNASAEERRAFVQAQMAGEEAAASPFMHQEAPYMEAPQIVNTAYPGRGIPDFIAPGAAPPRDVSPTATFDVETAINNLDVYFLGRKHATEIGEFGQTVDSVIDDMVMEGERRATPHEPPLTSLRQKGDRNISLQHPVELPTGTVLEILSDPNPARKGTMHAIKQEVEQATRSFIKEAGEKDPLFLFDPKQRKALELIFSTDPKNRGALVQILDPETPISIEGELAELLQPGATPGKGNNFVQILDAAGLPGALIAARAGPPRSANMLKRFGPGRIHELTWERALAEAEKDLAEEGASEAKVRLMKTARAKKLIRDMNVGFEADRAARMRYVAATFEFLEGNRYPRVTKAQNAWASYNHQRQNIKRFYHFRALPDPGTDEAVVPPATGLVQTVVDLMRRHNPKLLARDILEPRGEELAAALDEIRPPQYSLPKVPVRQTVGQSASTIDSHLLPLNHPSFDTNFKRELPTGQIVRLNPTAFLTKGVLPDPLPPDEDLFLVVDEVAFLGAASNKPEKAIALVRLANILDPRRGGIDEEGSILFLASPKKGGFPFGPVDLADLPELSGILKDSERVPIARNLAKQLRSRFAPTVDQLGERGENLFMISDPNGRPRNFTSEREHALVAANQGFFVTPEPFGKLASFEAKRGMSLDDTTLAKRFTSAKQRVSLRHSEDLFTEYSDIASLDTEKRSAAIRHLARSLLLNEKTLVKHTNTLGAKAIGRLFRLEEAIEDLPRDVSGRVLARKMRQRASEEALTPRKAIDNPLSLDALAADVSRQKELPIGAFTEESLDEAAQSYFSAADEIRLFREMRSTQAKMSLATELAKLRGKPLNPTNILEQLPHELKRLASQRGLNEALDVAQSVSKEGLPTSEIREQARKVLLANPEYLGRNEAERARARRMLRQHAERATKGQPFGVTVEQIAEAKIREVDPRFSFKKLSYNMRKMIRQQFLDQVSDDPALFMTDFIAAHVATQQRRGWENITINISYVDDGLPEITIRGFDPKSGQTLRRAVPLSSENVISFQGVVPGNWSSSQLWEEFEQKVKSDPMLGGICNIGDVNIGE